MSRKVRSGFFLALLLVLQCPVALAEDDTFGEDNVLSEAGEFLGEGTAGVAEVIEKLFAESTESPVRKTFNHSMLLAFFFALRSCEYLRVGGKYKRRTKALQLPPSHRFRR